MGAAQGSLCLDTRSQTSSADHATEPEKVTAEKAVTEIEIDSSTEGDAPPFQIQKSIPRSPQNLRCSRLLKTVLRVDKDLLRAVPLKATLRQFGRLWRVCPADLPVERRAELWSSSVNVESFDIFLSHTWWTSGRWKYLALMLRFGLLPALSCWLVAIVLIQPISIWGLLPRGDSFQMHFAQSYYSIPFSAWTFTLANLSALIGFFLWPYLPWLGKQRCFLDVASINQDDKVMMERGIYGLGGFLNASAELLILWSEPYFSRLWCVFELAAFRSANPLGKITFAPLFVESSVAVLWIGCYLVGLVFFLSMIVIDQLFNVAPVVIGILPALVPVYGVLHVLRMRLKAKHRLFFELENFRLDSVECREDFDRRFIHSAIVQWYGSHEEFEAFVRGPLREELLACQVDTQLPVLYSFTMITPLLTLGMDCLAAIIVTEDTPIEMAISYFFGAILGLMLCWGMVSIRLAVHLCDRFADPPRPFLSDHGHTLLVFVVWGFVTVAGVRVATWAYSGSLTFGLVWFVVAVLLMLFAYGESELLRQSHRLASATTHPWRNSRTSSDSRACARK